MKKASLKLIFVLLAIAATIQGAAGAQNTHDAIDRQSVVTRNNPKISEVDTLGSLTVGRGSFAATVDVTGLQSFPDHYASGIPLCTMSDGGWHSFANTDSLTPADSRRTYNLHGRDSEYAVEYKQEGRGKKATEYFRVNPHRLNLATVGLQFFGADGSQLDIDRVVDINQQLDLWSGMIESDYTVDGYAFEVTTAVMGDKDCLFSRISSPMLVDGKARLSIRFPYPTGVHSDAATSWVPTDTGGIRVLEEGSHSVLIERTIGTTKYYVRVLWEGDCRFDADTATETCYLYTEADQMSVAVEFADSPEACAQWPYAFEQASEAVKDYWTDFWMSGGIVDFGMCTDPRAAELERRTVLSQYLTAINCAGSMPPQETGLTYNSWFGRPHLEMTWWHAVDFALWSRPQVIEKMLEWYNSPAGMDEARALAERQGFNGIRWLKMTDPWGGEAPSNVGSFLTWQQPHYIYLAEEMYRAKPDAETLAKYAKGVETTAEFMADFARACAEGDGPIKLHGQTAMQESMSYSISYNHPFEQAYWLYGLQTAQAWRERQGLPRSSEYDEIIERMAPLAADDRGIYPSGEFLPGANIDFETFMLKSRSDHPAVLGACGLLPDASLYDQDVMRSTLQWIMDNWEWETTWGWDYGMIAMAAARLGEPETAVDALLIDKGKNTYLVNGHNFQEPKRLRLYLPGNGALLTAVAMMCAGWDGSESDNPGFPHDGTWQVRHEGIKKMQ